MRPQTITAILGAAALLHASALAAVDIKQESDKVTVAVGGAPFTEYHFTPDASHVYFYPLLGPGGARMTRAWPMEDVATEEHDHPHHRSLWFAHGDVNGIDFWAETSSFAGKPSKMPLGKIVHQKFLEVKGGEKEGVIQSLNNWEAPDGTVVLTSTQTFRVYETGTPERIFDFEVVLTAGAKDVLMADTKEGSMALRMAESMRVTQPKTKPAGVGHMLNSEGVKDVDCWGKRADWVDYSGPVDGKTVGITMLEHPSNPRHPTRWHARDYGLFAANPFCNQQMDKSQPEHSGDVTIPAGQSYTLKYRFLIHSGEADPAAIATAYADYSKTK